MKYIFKARSKLRILIDTHCDLSGYEDVKIWARKPDGNVVSLSYHQKLWIGKNSLR